MVELGPKSGVVPQKSLRKQSVLRKICYVRYGSANEADLANLCGDLLDFRKDEGESAISRQAITYWFQNKFPYRQKSLFFLLKYLDARVDRGRLEKRRAEAYSEVSQRIRNQIGVSPGYENLVRNNRRIHINKRGQLNIELLLENMVAVRRLGKQLKGVYLVYHSRLTEDSRGQVTQEVMRIAPNKGELEFELWYFREGVDVQKYNGVIFVYGNIMWFLCSANSEPDRLRVMNFKVIDSISDKYTDMRVGLMLSDIPVPNFNDPVSCRVLIQKIRTPDNVLQFAKETVRNFDPVEFRADSPFEEREIGRLMMTLVDNKRTASSDSGSINLTRDERGIELKDHLLKVDQTTINKFAERMSSLSGPSAGRERTQASPKQA